MVHSFDEALKLAKFTVEREGQRGVFDAFRAGKHIILRAPTGWGKTFAVLAALALGEGHAIYSLPLRVLVDSLANEAAKWNIRRVKAHHGTRREHAFLDRGDDVDNPIECVFTTLDQSLSAYLGIPIGVSMRQGNILPAVIEASHLVFDEFHLFEAGRSWRTALTALKNSKQNGIILTATLSDTMVDFLVSTLADTEQGVQLIEADRPFVNKKQIQKSSGFTNYNSFVLGNRTIIIRNQIEWAKETVQWLKQHIPAGTAIYLLHSELLPEDRQQIEKEICKVFGKNGSGPAILVSTQVIEAGIDLTCDVLHTDICPPASLIQRIGRSARYEGESSQIFWHTVDSINPYKFAEAEIIALENYLQTVSIIDELVERFIVNLSADRDRESICQFQTNNDSEWVNEARVFRDYSKYADLIRDINNTNVAIGVNVFNEYIFISISPGKFHGNGPYANLITKPVRIDYDRKEKRKTAIDANSIETADFVLLCPDQIGYVPGFGLSLEKLGGEELFLDQRVNQRERHEYNAETAELYREHIERLQKYRPVCQWLVERLASYVGGIEKATYLADFVVWAHDLGKLDIEWQAAHNVPVNGIPIGHSGGEFKRIKSPPSHAWISAWSVTRFLSNHLFKSKESKRIARPVFWAIADHHGYKFEISREVMRPYSISFFEHLNGMQDMAPWKQNNWNKSILIPSVSHSEINGIWEEIHKHGGQWRMQVSDKIEVYYLLSYILRRSDQLATSEVSTSVVEAEKKDVPKRKNFL